MSDPIREPVPSTLEHARKQAKSLLHEVRAADPDAMRRVRAWLPGLASLSDPEVLERLKLADVQHAIAREQGFERWADLKRELEAREPVDVLVERFLEAVRDAKLDVARRLLSARPELASADFCVACCVGDAAVVGEWLRRDPSVATRPRGAEAWPPLIYLAHSRFHSLDAKRREGSLRCAELLLEHGASPDTSIPAEGPTPLSALYHACVSNNVGVVRLLLERGADPNDHESVYHAAELNHRECLELLLAHGVRLSERNHVWTNTPLYFLAGYREGNAHTAIATEGMRWLLEHGADPNVTSGPTEETPLHRLVDFGRGVDAVGMLLDHGADATRVRGDGRTPYVLAVRTGNRAVEELLRARGAAVGEPTAADRLLGACLRADEPEARTLLAENRDLFALLGAEDRSAMMIAAQQGRVESVRLIVALGFDPSWEGPHGGTLLHWAAWWGRPGVVRLLIELGAPVNVRDRMYGSSPIAWASHGSVNCRSADDDYVAVIGALLDAGSEYAPSISHWGSPPESLGSRRVIALLRDRGFAAGA